MLKIVQHYKLFFIPPYIPISGKWECSFRNNSTSNLSEAVAILPAYSQSEKAPILQSTITINQVRKYNTTLLYIL